MQSGRYDYQDIIRHKTYQEPPSFYGLSPGDHDWAAGFLRGDWAVAAPALIAVIARGGNCGLS